jgi:hypothetical protein
MSTLATVRTSKRLAIAVALRRTARIALASALSICAACTGGGGGVARERLDEASGVTVLADVRPIVFARTETRYSRSGRDYLFLGPVEANRQGNREYYLWVGVGTTLDRGYIAPEDQVPDVLYAEVAGEPLELALRPWQDREPQLDRKQVYRTAVPLRTELAARVTLSELELLSRASLASVRVGVRGAAARVYFRWDDQPVWRNFFGAVTAVGDRRPSPNGTPP